jgi:hypothetical protein
MSTQQLESTTTPIIPKNKGKLAIDFSTVDDLFLNAKGKALRNKQKKLDKIKQTEKAVKGGSITTTDAQKEMIATKPALEAETKELNELCELYILSNPSWNKKEAPKVEEIKVDVEAIVRQAFTVYHQFSHLDENVMAFGDHTKSFAELKAATDFVSTWTEFTLHRQSEHEAIASQLVAQEK